MLPHNIRKPYNGFNQTFGLENRDKNIQKHGIRNDLASYFYIYYL